MKVILPSILLMFITSCSSTPQYLVQDCIPIDKTQALSMQSSFKGASIICIGSTKYPYAAVEERIEGHAVVQFDVLPDGSTTNIVVLESMPAGVFEKVAADAMTKTKFKPSDAGFAKLLYKYGYKF